MVTLSTDKPTAVTLGSSSLTIPAGALSATFAVTAKAGGAVAGGNIVSLSAKSGTWLQGAKLSVISSTLPLTVQSVRDAAGNGCALLQWSALPPGSIQGYRVYRVNGAGVATPITPQPIFATIFAESGLTGGQSYTYRVSAVDWSGSESLSPNVTVVPTSSGTTLAWSATPVSFDGTTATFQVQPNDSQASSSELHLIVDGFDAGILGAQSVGASNPLPYAAIDTTGLTNGTHAAQVVGFSSDGAVATPVINFTVQNTISETYVSTTVTGATGNAALVRAVVDGIAPTWTATITHEDLSTGTVTTVRTWNGVGNVARVAWDGKDESGNSVASGDYTVQLSTMQAGNQTTVDRHWWRMLGLPTAVALVSDINHPATIVPKPNSGQKAGNATQQHRDAIILAYQKMQQAGNDCELYAPPADRFTVTSRPNEATTLSQETAANLRLLVSYLESSVQDFYLYGHGNGGHVANHEKDGVKRDWDYPPQAIFGGIWFMSGEPTLSPNQTDPQWKPIFGPDWVIFTHDTSRPQTAPEGASFIRLGADRIYNFVWIDTCNSAGGLPPNDPTVTLPPWAVRMNPQPPKNGQPSQKVTNWRDAFNIGEGGNATQGKITTFMGWNGKVGLDTLDEPGQASSGTQSPWAYWRSAFWSQVCIGGRTIMAAISSLNFGATPKTLSAISQGKLFTIEDHDFNPNDTFYPWYLTPANVPRLFIDGDLQGRGFLPGMPGQ